MEVHLPLLVSTRLPTSAPALRTLALGAVLQATVVRGGTSEIQIRIGNDVLTAATSAPLTAGRKLNLMVERAGSLPVLRIMNTPPAPTGSPLPQALARALPRQEPLADLVRRAPVAVERTRSTPTLVDVVRPFAVAVDGPVKGVTVRHAIVQSGPFHEARFATPAPTTADRQPAAGDLKAGLLLARAIVTASPTPVDRGARTGNASGQPSAPAATPQSNMNASLSRAPVVTPRPASAPVAARGGEVPPVTVAQTPEAEAADTIESALARVETHQLRSLVAAMDGHYVVSTDLPLLTAGGLDAAPLLIEKDGAARTAEDEPTAYTAALEVPLAEDGSLRALISATEDRVSIRLWSESDSLRRSIDSRLDELRAGLDAQGVSAARIVIGEVDSVEQRAPRPARLIDQQA